MSDHRPQHQIWADAVAQPLPGFDGRMTVKVLTGVSAQVMQVTLSAGVTFPNPKNPDEQETHPSEQFLNIVSGRVRAVIGGEEYFVGAEESILMPANVPHSLEVLEDTLMLEVFAPPVPFG